MSEYFFKKNHGKSAANENMLLEKAFKCDVGAAKARVFKYKMKA